MKGTMTKRCFSRPPSCSAGTETSYTACFGIFTTIPHSAEHHAPRARTTKLLQRIKRNIRVILWNIPITGLRNAFARATVSAAFGDCRHSGAAGPSKYTTLILGHTYRDLMARYLQTVMYLHCIATAPHCSLSLCFFTLRDEKYFMKWYLQGETDSEQCRITTTAGIETSSAESPTLGYTPQNL
jgi:hypothetical protein